MCNICIYIYIYTYLYIYAYVCMRLHGLAILYEVSQVWRLGGALLAGAESLQPSGPKPAPALGLEVGWAQRRDLEALQELQRELGARVPLKEFGGLIYEAALELLG